MRILFLGIVFGIIIGWWWSAHTVNAPESERTSRAPIETLDPVIAAHIADKADVITLSSPTPNHTITSPLTITGEARGYWFFEASFPIVLTNWDGLIIAEGYATADGDWMTEDFVPFSATLEFISPYEGGSDFMKRGSLILKKDNPSGLPQYDDALEIPVYFAPKTALEVSKEPSFLDKKITVYDGIEVSESTEVLNLSGKTLSGSLKAEVRHLTKLQELDLSHNNFTGLPAEIGQLSALRVLNVSYNPLTGLPYELGNLQSLELLDIRGTNYAKADLMVIQERLPASVTILVD